MRWQSLAIVCLCWITAPVSAQVKFSILDDDKGQLKNVVFQEASSRRDIQHGKLVRLTLNNDTHLKGVVVRTDRKNDTLFVRTGPGVAPQPVPMKDIKHIDKGVIRQVGTTADVNEPEIQPLIVYNGGRKSVTYSAPTLSPGELAQLEDLAAAETELARVQYLARLERRAMETNATSTNQLRRSQELFNEYLWRQLAYTGFPALGIYTPLEWPSTLWGPFPQVMTPGSLSPGGGPNSQKLLITPDVMLSAERHAEAARSHAIFENGHLVAVVANNQAK